MLPIRAIAAAIVAATGCATAPPRPVAWRDFSPETFTAAREQKKLVLLDLGTGWCHWCHVMEETTYADPAVRRLLDQHYVSAKADADSRLDLANRYEQYGWPATILFAADGTELVKLRGYVEPKQMAAMLQACVDDPTPGPSARAAREVAFSTTSALPAALASDLRSMHVANYDETHAGYGTVQKYLPEWVIEWDLELARRGDADAAKRARATLAANRKLIDPAWGGVYQYSHGGDWDHPHFEKVMSFQSLDLRLYSQAYELWHDPADAKTAQDVHRYLTSFLRGPDGAFFTSQDADLVDGEHGGEYFALDDSGRRKLGMPRIDRNVYARENGWAIEGLAVLFEATGDATALEQAQAAARAILATRRAPDGAFRHGERDTEAAYLGDTLAMGIALLELHQCTGARDWLDAAVAAGDAIEKQFGPTSAGLSGAVADANAAGYPTSLPRPDPTGALPGRQRDENLSVARFANRLHAATGEARFLAMRDRALRFVVTPEIAREFPPAGVLLVATEAASDPLHVVVVAPRDDAAADDLFALALAAPTRHKLVQRWSPKEDPPLAGGATYPELDRAAAYVCTATSCSPPVFDALALGKLLKP
jgi:uncharacterized protein YyaL (SSP411 family)